MSGNEYLDYNINTGCSISLSAVWTFINDFFSQESIRHPSPTWSGDLPWTVWSSVPFRETLECSPPLSDLSVMPEHARPRPFLFGFWSETVQRELRRDGPSSQDVYYK